MQEFIDELIRVRNRLGQIANELGLKYALADTDHPVGAFPMCFNNATVALELTSHYVAAWNAAGAAANQLTPDQIAQKRAETAQRLMILAKTTFVWSLSIIEFSAKSAMRAYPAVLPTNKEIASLYLGNVILLSADNGLIDPVQRPLWFGTNTIRNKVVHNNGIGDGDAIWQFTPQFAVTMQAGQMIQGTIMTFPLLTAWLVEAYRDWSDRFLTTALA